MEVVHRVTDYHQQCNNEEGKNKTEARKKLRKPFTKYREPFLDWYRKSFSEKYLILQDEPLSWAH